MTKGHNKGMNNPSNEHKGGEGKLKKKQREKVTPAGKRNAKTEEEAGNKGPNSI